MTNTLPPLPEPAQKPYFFCNKCGSTGYGESYPHKRRDGTECGYMAVTTGPLYSPDQLRSYAEEAVRLEREAIAAEWELAHGFDKHGVAASIRSRSEGTT